MGEGGICTHLSFSKHKNSPIPFSSGLPGHVVYVSSLIFLKLKHEQNHGCQIRREQSKSGVRSDKVWMCVEVTQYCELQVSSVQDKTR
jgi:hypothetical protein